MKRAARDSCGRKAQLSGRDLAITVSAGEELR